MGAHFSDGEMGKQAGLRKSLDRNGALVLLHVASLFAVVTKMVALERWKRYEMNDLLRCSGTTEGSCMSIVCRSLTIVHKAKFLYATFPVDNSSASLYVVRDGSRKAFLTSRGVPHASMSMIFCFMSWSAPKYCRITTDPHAAGGNGGVVFVATRKASNNDLTKETAVSREDTSRSHHVAGHNRASPVAVEASQPLVGDNNVLNLEPLEAR